MEFAGRGVINEWIQHFLRNDGKNIALADGLLLEKRYYFGPIVADLSEFGIEEGAPWDIPPLIVNYADGIFEICDGRHRNEALRQMNIKHVPVVF